MAKVSAWSAGMAPTSAAVYAGLLACLAQAGTVGSVSVKDCKAPSALASDAWTAASSSSLDTPSLKASRPRSDRYLATLPAMAARVSPLAGASRPSAALKLTVTWEPSPAVPRRVVSVG